MSTIQIHTISESQPGTATANVRMRIRSAVPGRERWEVPILKGNAPLAAAAQLLLRGEPGVIHAGANPVTGRILVIFNAAQIERAPQVMIRHALSFGPLSSGETSDAQSRSASPARDLILAELGCTALQGLLFSGGSLPAGRVVTLLMIAVIHRRG